MTIQKAVEVLEELKKPGRFTILAPVCVYDAIRIAIDALNDVPDTNVGDIDKDKNVPNKTFTVIDTKTGKEADHYEIALNEDWANKLMYCDMEGFAIEEDGSLILVDECGQYKYCPEGRFEVRWDEE